MLLCSTPPSAPGATIVTVGPFSNQDEAGIIRFEYLPSPLISKVIPATAVLQTSLTVTVHGFGFVNGDSLMCGIGEGNSAHVRWISASTVECTAFLSSPGNYSVSISNTGQNATLAKDLVTVYGSPQFHHVKPVKIAIRRQQSMLTIVGAGFDRFANDSLSCGFDTTPWPGRGTPAFVGVAKQVSVSSIQCWTPQVCFISRTFGSYPCCSLWLLQ